MPDVDYDDYHADDAGLRCRSRQGREAGERRLRDVNDHHDDAQHFHDDSEHELDDHDHGSWNYDDRVFGRRSPGGFVIQAEAGGKG